MLLPLCPNLLSLPPKTLAADQSSPFPLFSFPHTYPKTLFSRNPKPSKFPIRCSTVKTHTLPKSAIRKIADKLRSLGYVDQDPKQIITPKIEPEPDGSSGEIFVPLPRRLPKFRVGHTIDSSWSLPGNPVPAPGSGSLITRFNDLRSEVKKQLANKLREEKKPTLAELTLPKDELKRLQGIGIGIKKKLKVGKAGITEGIVNGIHERWRRTELVKLVCDDLCKLNMKRTHDLLERRTGGLVIWRSGSKIILYRGIKYEYPYFFSDSGSTNEDSSGSAPVSCVDDGEHNRAGSYLSGADDVKSAEQIPSNKMAQASLIPGVGSPNRVRFQFPGEEQLTEEADRLLDGLGPRFSDWWGCDPQPVDADLLPGVVSGYRRPFRILPYGVNPKLTNDEMTTLRRLGRPLPCHFALGRNRKHQGLAASIIKLWEKSEIAKIAIKRGVQNTNSELMAEELRRLTGGTLLSRDREFIVLYRGKDFLPIAVSSAIEERRKYLIGTEKQRKDCGSSVINMPGTIENVSGDESDEINGQKRVQNSGKKKMQSTGAAIYRTSIILSRALEKKAKAEELLSELEGRQSHKEPDVDKEGITKEERYMLRRVGLRMKPFLLLGRRGVFDGTVENMHLHWKYRELVKILCNQKSNQDACVVARTLEAESGGILVAVERVRKGYAIIVYRGKNYTRPTSLRPQTLLNKREAMKRSLEAQRCESIKLHVLKLNRRIDDLIHRLDKNEEMNRAPSTEESKIQLVTEENVNNLQSPDYERLDSEPKPGFSSCSLLHACDEENVVEVREEYGSMDTIDGTYALGDGLKITQQAKKLVENEDKIDEPDETELQIASTSVLQGNYSDVAIKNVKGGNVKNTSCPEISESQGLVNRSASKDAEHHVSGNDRIDPSLGSDNDLKLSRGGVGNWSNRTTDKASPLSNSDRLLLRKQALKMRKRPVLAVGRSNIVGGVAKAIMTHFKKHPLAIVNVKARDKGTPIQELVFKLEQTTGAVLVSQETNKVILYRGWGAGIEPGCADKENKGGASRQSVWKRVEAQPAVSPELMAAIRSECGFQN